MTKYFYKEIDGARYYTKKQDNQLRDFASVICFLFVVLLLATGIHI